jgi:biopolymer transport protein ExbB
VKRILSTTRIARLRWLLLALLLPVLAPTPAAAWWQTDWSYRKQITIDTTPKGANIADPAGRVAVLVRLHSGNFSFSDAQDNGADLRFVGSDDKTPLTFHIESYDPLLGVATIWVDVPDFPAGSAKQIWLYYGNKKAPPAGDAAQTFDPDYALVYHFDQAAGAPPKDATAYGNNALTAPSGIDDGAIIGKGARFSGTAAIAVPPSSSLAIAAGGSFTFSAWVKSDVPQARGGLYTRRDGASSLVVGLDQGVPFAEIGGATPARVAGTQAIAKGAWTQIAVTADGKTLTLFVNGHSVGSTPGSLPALNTVTALGGEAPNTTPAGTPTANFIGEMDEIRISKIARPAALVLADDVSQGPDQHLVVFGADEKQAGFGFGYFGIIVKSVTVDAWVVISILGLMAVISWFVMFSKATYVGSVDSGNDAFLELFRRQGGDPLSIDESALRGGTRRKLANSSIYRIFRAGADEMRRRASQGGQLVLSAEGIEVIRALMDATLVRENQRLARNMVLLTISISGGPFLGLLGTVVGVMITFAAIAASGDVNVNAIAPGISAALLATVAGLAVAIPALFGYNYLIIRNKNVTANMQVFVDEFITRLAELYSNTGRGSHVRAAE